METIEGRLVVTEARFALVAARFNGMIVESLIEGARDTLLRHGAGEDALTLLRVPGAFELPGACARAANSGRFDAVLALGCVIRGGTPHFDYVASACTRGLATLALEGPVPVAFGVLTVDNLEQAIERSGTKAGNKGAEAALSALEMVNLYRALPSS